MIYVIAFFIGISTFIIVGVTLIISNIIKHNNCTLDTTGTIVGLKKEDASVGLTEYSGTAVYRPILLYTTLILFFRKLKKQMVSYQLLEKQGAVTDISDTDQDYTKCQRMKKLSNPNNLCIFKGRIGSNLKFIKRKDGTEYACEFYLDVMRNYRNDGTYLYDSAPLRLAGEGIMPFARTLEKGDYLDVV